MRVGQTSVRPPHDLVELPEFTKEARVGVVDLFDVIAKERVLVVLDIPDAVGHAASASTSNLLLLGSPLRQLDLVREQSTTSHDVDQSELGLNCSESFLGQGSLGLLLDNLNAEQVIGIALKALVAVCRDLVLPIGFGDRGSHIV